MVRVVDCHAGVLGSNPGGPRYFPLGITSHISGHVIGIYVCVYKTYLFKSLNALSISLPLTRIVLEKNFACLIAKKYLHRHRIGMTN